MSEHRQAIRMRRLKDARLVFNGRKSVMNCTVRNASEQGAKLHRDRSGCRLFQSWLPGIWFRAVLN